MNAKTRLVGRVALVLAAVAAFGIPVAPALGQTTPATSTMMSIDAPTDGAAVANGSQIDVGGWAVDTAGPGTGVDSVRVYLDGKMDAGGTLLGNANYGGSRPDVASSLGNPAFAASGFDLLWTPQGLSGGTHTLYVYAHSLANGWSYKTVGLSARAASPTPAPRGGGAYGPGGYMPPQGSYPGPGMYPGPSYSGGYPYPYPYPNPRPYNPPPPGSGGRVCIMIYPPPPGC